MGVTPQAELGIFRFDLGVTSKLAGSYSAIPPALVVANARGAYHGGVQSAEVRHAKPAPISGEANPPAPKVVSGVAQWRSLGTVSVNSRHPLKLGLAAVEFNQAKGSNRYPYIAHAVDGGREQFQEASGVGTLVPTRFKQRVVTVAGWKSTGVLRLSPGIH